MKKNQFLQVILPFLLVLCLIGFGTYALISGDLTNIRQAGDIAGIYLVYLFITPAFIWIILMTFMIVLVYKGSVSFKNFSPKIHRVFERISGSTVDLSARITKPIIEIDSYLSIFSKLCARKGKDEQEF